MLKHGILGLLNYGKMTGYEINEVFNTSLKFFWKAQTSQIYRELQNLKNSGYIEMVAVEQQGKPIKNVCGITDSGRRELIRWLGEDIPDAAQNSPLLMKVFFMGERSYEENAEYFKNIKSDCESFLKELENVEEIIKSFSEMIDDPKKSLYWQMTLDFGRRYMRTCIEWADVCAKKIGG